MSTLYNNGIRSIVPTAFIMMTSGGYQPQHLRSWSLVGNMQQVNSLAEHIAQCSARSVNSSLINKAAPGILGLSAEHQGVISIADGWGSNRGVYILRFLVTYNVGNTFEWIVQGYTDNPAFTAQYIDPNMVFYINNVFCMSRTTATYNGIQTSRMNLQADYQVVNGYGGGINGTGNLLIRPRDVMSNIASADLLGLVKVTDATQLANFGVQTSRHTNNVPSMMLADALNSWHAASSELDPTACSGTIAENAYAKVLETEAGQDLFMSILARHNSTGSMTSSFTGNQLMKAMEGIMSVYQPVTSSGTSVQWSSPNDSMGFADMNSAARAIAVNIQAMLPSIMVESLLSSVSFTASNHTGGVQIVPQHVGAFMPDMAERQWDIFSNRLVSEVIPLFTRLGWPFVLQVSCSFYQEIKIYIKLDTDEVQFIAPAFANALCAPVQTTSALHAREFAQQFETLAVTVDEALMESGIRRAAASNAQIDMVAPARLNNAFTMPSPTHAVPPAAVTVAAPASGGMTSGLDVSIGLGTGMGNVGGMVPGHTTNQPSQFSNPLTTNQGSMFSGLNR